MAKTITVDNVMGWNPCVPRESFAGLVTAKPRWTAREIADLPADPDSKLWVILRRELWTDAQLRWLACDFAETTLGAWYQVHGPPIALQGALRTMRDYCAGKAYQRDVHDAHCDVWQLARKTRDDPDYAKAAIRAVAWATDFRLPHAAIKAAWFAASCYARHRWHADPADMWRDAREQQLDLVRRTGGN